MQEELRDEKTTVSCLPEGKVEGNGGFSFSKAKNTDFFVLSSFCIFSEDFFTHSGQFGPKKKENQH